MVVALKPLHDAATIKRVVVATYQSVSGAGKAGMDELFEQSRNIFVGDRVEPGKFTKQIAFNVIPHIDVFLDDGSTKEEWKMVVETKKILDPKIKVDATCVRVPVFVGHSEAINIEFENEISAEEAQEILREAPGVMLVDKREDGGYVTPIECVGEYATFVSRVREDPTVAFRRFAVRTRSSGHVHALHEYRALRDVRGCDLLVGHRPGRLRAEQRHARGDRPRSDWRVDARRLVPRRVRPRRPSGRGCQGHLLEDRARVVHEGFWETAQPRA